MEQSPYEPSGPVPSLECVADFHTNLEAEREEPLRELVLGEGLLGNPRWRVSRTQSAPEVQQARVKRIEDAPLPSLFLNRTTQT